MRAVPEGDLLYYEVKMKVPIITTKITLKKNEKTKQGTQNKQQN